MVKKMRKASLTIEAACVFPIVLMAVMGLLHLSFFVHNRTWLTAAAYEAALCGSMEGIKKEGKVYEAAQMRGEELGNSGFFGGENLRLQTTAGKKVTVAYDMDTTAGPGIHPHLHAEGSSAVIQPVKWVRKIKAAAGIWNGAGDEK